MRNSDLVRRFVYGDESGKGSNLCIQGRKLINYETCIAYRHRTAIILNGYRYSVTTSKIQSYVRYHSATTYEVSSEKVFNEVVTMLERKDDVSDLLDRLKSLNEAYNSEPDADLDRKAKRQWNKDKKENIEFEEEQLGYLLDEYFERTPAPKTK